MVSGESVHPGKILARIPDAKQSACSAMPELALLPVHNNILPVANISKPQHSLEQTVKQCKAGLGPQALA